jgi:hypothetical protein
MKHIFLIPSSLLALPPRGSGEKALMHFKKANETEARDERGEEAKEKRSGARKKKADEGEGNKN